MHEDQEVLSTGKERQTPAQREFAALRLLLDDPAIPADAMAEPMVTSQATVHKALQRLQRDARVRRVFEVDVDKVPELLRGVVNIETAAPSLKEIKTGCTYQDNICEQIEQRFWHFREREPLGDTLYLRRMDIVLGDTADISVDFVVEKRGAECVLDFVVGYIRTIKYVEKTTTNWHRRFISASD
ncbi:MAG: hypothetical protein AAGB51_14055 [Planctomycetota bacterium]